MSLILPLLLPTYKQGCTATRMQCWNASSLCVCVCVHASAECNNRANAMMCGLRVQAPFSTRPEPLPPPPTKWRPLSVTRRWTASVSGRRSDWSRPAWLPILRTATPSAPPVSNTHSSLSTRCRPKKVTLCLNTWTNISNFPNTVS